MLSCDGKCGSTYSANSSKTSTYGWRLTLALSAAWLNPTVWACGKYSTKPLRPRDNRDTPSAQIPAQRRYTPGQKKVHRASRAPQNPAHRPVEPAVNGVAW